MSESTAADGSGATLPVRVELRHCTIQAGSQVLLADTSAHFEAGDVTLIVGRSGVGKSTLLKAIAGLIDRSDEGLHMSGEVVLCDSRGTSRGTLRKDRQSVGVVFQDFALFDELSPTQNVQLARDHCPRTSPDDQALDPRRLLHELGVPTRVRTAALSGGQRQRLAIARVLAYDPRVVLYDEPTSGLDRATAGDVTRVIERAHTRHPCTLIIVTHDHESLSRIADAIYLIDARTATLRRVDRADWAKLDEKLQQSSAVVEDLAPVDVHTSSAFVAWVRRGSVRFLTETSRVIEAATTLPWRLVPAWQSPWWGLRFLLHYLRAVAGLSAWLYIAVAGAIIGFVATYFTFRFLPNANYTKPLLIEDLLRSMGFALYRILVPILVTILIAARCGAAVASDVGGKRYGRQIDALKTLGIVPERYLLTGILYAFLLGTPLLLAIGYLSAGITSLVAFTSTHPDRGPWFWQLNFHRELVVPNQLLYAGTYWLWAKTTACAAGIAAIAYARGARPKDSSRAVSQGVTSTILWATLYVLAVHFVFAFLEFK
jgi:ABC-type polar amino acid transport system ATPase subunit/ABC-type transporter Mla maintaining outer membrane lipid asymmetry permease subunit MlaE